MASKRHIRRKSCGDKQQHATKLQARAHATALRYTKGDLGLAVYHCQFGDHWHVGHHG